MTSERATVGRVEGTSDLGTVIPERNAVLGGIEARYVPSMSSAD